MKKNQVSFSLTVTDLNYVLHNTFSLWERLRNQKIFITGGTGFFGCWLLETLAWANQELALNATATILTRNIKKFKDKCPHLYANHSFNFLEGNVKNFEFPSEHYSYIIHAATEASVSLNQNNPQEMLETIVQGTQRTLDFALQTKADSFLLTSSGAVYGKQPSDIAHLSEEYICPKIEGVGSAYADGKRAAESMCIKYAERFKLDIKIARCFAFVGPYLPLDTHFAIGNFIRDGLNGNKIIIEGDGSAYRSYLYAADLVIWLWTILFRGQTMRPYNVGSDKAYSIKEIAYLVAECFENKEVCIQQKASGQPSQRYIPSIFRAKNELNLGSEIELPKAIQLTKEWYSSHRK